MKGLKPTEYSTQTPGKSSVNGTQYESLCLTEVVSLFNLHYMTTLSIGKK